MDMAKRQASDEVHLLSRTIVKDIESLDYVQQMDEYIVYRVADSYVKYIADKDAKDALITTVLRTIEDDAKLASLSENVKKLAFHNSADVIAEEVYKLAIEYKNKKK
jgi:UDP-N-acetylglucosamine:LPS N-acetylglucosamine transferase